MVAGKAVSAREDDTQSVEKIGELFTDQDLKHIESFEDALAALESAKIGVRDARELGAGYDVLDKQEKDALVGVPFVMLQWRFNNGDMGVFVSVHCMTRHGAKYILNDGSTGICRQLQEYTNESGRRGGLLCEKGLTRSEYTMTAEKHGEENDGRIGTTYYIA